MVIKTRDKLIDVARKLFAHKGVEKTTMNDIAEASDKGRRTIYTYFKNKDEICDAIIESETDELLSQLKEVVEQPLDPLSKLERYLRVRFDFLMNIIPTKDYFTLLFSQQARRGRKIRKLSLIKEQALFEKVLSEGVELGTFDRTQADRLPAVQSMMVQAIRVVNYPGQAEECGFHIHDLREKIIEFIITGVKACTPQVPPPATI